MNRFDRDNIPPAGVWSHFRKKVVTPMVRIDGPFTVATKEGELHCPDGWLALDQAGWPYPISAADQADMYEPAEDSP